MLPVEPEGIPWQATPILRRALGRNPAARYASLGDLVQALERLEKQAGVSSESPEEHARREEAALAWREAQQKMRNQAEESARLAALEQARREIDEQLRRESAAAPTQIPADETLPPPPPVPQEPGRLIGDDINDLALPEIKILEPARRRSRRSRSRSLWPLGLLLLFVLLFFGARWLGDRFSREGLFPYTATWTMPAPTATLTPSPLPTDTSTPEPTSTLTPTASATGDNDCHSNPYGDIYPDANDTLIPTRTFTPSNTPRRKTPLGTLAP